MKREQGWGLLSLSKCGVNGRNKVFLSTDSILNHLKVTGDKY